MVRTDGINKPPPHTNTQLYELAMHVMKLSTLFIVFSTTCFTTCIMLCFISLEPFTIPNSHTAVVAHQIVRSIHEKRDNKKTKGKEFRKMGNARKART